MIRNASSLQFKVCAHASLLLFSFILEVQYNDTTILFSVILCQNLSVPKLLTGNLLLTSNFYAEKLMLSLLGKWYSKYLSVLRI